MTVVILDQQNNVVANLGTQSEPNVVTTVTLNHSNFIPEVNVTLGIAPGPMGGLISFNGVGSNGQPLPNGYYTVQLQSAGGQVVDATFYLDHQAWNDGRVIVVAPPHASAAAILWNYGQAVDVKVEIFDLASEQVWKGSAADQAGGRIDWGLISASGRPAANGIYIMKFEADSLDGSLQDIRFVKIAVVR
jgi:hypothetical protein